jgi:hypothetical protein
MKNNISKSIKYFASYFVLLIVIDLISIVVLPPLSEYLVLIPIIALILSFIYAASSITAKENRNVAAVIVIIFDILFFLSTWLLYKFTLLMMLIAFTGQSV